MNLRSAILISAAMLTAFQTGRVSTESLPEKVDRLDKEIKTLRNGACPIGSIVAWPSAMQTPPGWHVCDGTPVEFDAELWAALIGLYGNVPQVDRVKTIKLPSFQGCFLRGKGPGSNEIGIEQSWATALPTDESRLIHASQQSSEMYIKHKYMQFRAGTGDLVHGIVVGSDTERTLVENASHKHPLGGGDSETRPKNFSVNWIIRIK